MKEKLSKEVISIAKALEAYKKKHNGNVAICCTLAAFDKDNEVIDDRIFAAGEIETILIGLEGAKEQIQAEDDEYIDW
jgi:hypothetical protein